MKSAIRRRGAEAKELAIISCLVVMATGFEDHLHSIH